MVLVNASRRVLPRGMFVIAMMTGFAIPVVVSAQSVADTADIVSVAEKTVFVTPGAQSAVITLVNPNKRKSAIVEIVAQFTPPKVVGAEEPNDFFSEDSAASERLRVEKEKTDSLGKLWSLASWIDSLPRQITIPPGARLPVTLKFAVPAGKPSGEYSAYVMVTTAIQVQGGDQQISMARGSVNFKPEFEVWPPEGAWPRRSVRLTYRVK